MLKNFLLALLIFTAAVSCSKKDEKTDIGFLGTLSGHYSDVGNDALKGVQLAIEQSGTADSINLVIKDDAGVPGDGLTAMSELENEGVRYIIGPNISTVATAVLPYLDGRYMFMLSPTVSTSELAGKDDHFLRTMPHNSQKQSENIAIYLRNKLKIDETVIIYDSRNISYANDIVKKFSSSFTSRGGRIRDVRPFNPESGVSMTTLIAQDRENPPKLYYIVASAIDTSLITWQIRKSGYRSKILIRGGAASNDFFRVGGDAVEGVYLFDYHIDKTTKAYRNFRDVFTKKYQKEPSFSALHGYECAVLLINSLPELKKGSGFYDALSANIPKMTLFQDFAFDEHGDSYMPLSFFMIEKGKAKRIGVAE